MKSIIAAAAGLAMLTLAGTAQAAPAPGGLKGAIAAEAQLVQKTHGFHRYCAWGPRGYHRHNRWGQRISCRRPWKRRGY
ncbi:MAG: hypothetical protein ACT4OU_11355 [Hyphomicrobium sp.]